MDGKSSHNTIKQTVLAHLRELVAEAKRGNAEVLPQIGEILDTHPELWQHYGDLTQHVEAKWLDLLSGADAAVRESLRRCAEQLRAELLKESDSPLEQLLVDRIVVSQLMMRFFDAAIALAVNEPEARVRFLQQQLDRAQKRHTAAIKSLAEVRKLLPGNHSARS